MTNKLFLTCLIIGLICAYCEYYWMRHGYHSLAFIASKCPKLSLQPSVHIANHAMLTRFWNLFTTSKDKQVVPSICETFEIHTNPRSIFILIKLICLSGLIFKLISSLKTIPTLIRTHNNVFKESYLISSMPSKGDGIMQRSTSKIGPSDKH